jgi:hypothetical protein
MTPDQESRIALPVDYDATRPWRKNRRREAMLAVLNWINGLRAR